MTSCTVCNLPRVMTLPYEAAKAALDWYDTRNIPAYFQTNRDDDDSYTVFAGAEESE